MLIIGVMQPFFSFWGDNDALLDKIRSETFTENLSEASRDISRMEYLRNDYYRREYENAAALDVKGTAEGYLCCDSALRQDELELKEGAICPEGNKAEKTESGVRANQNGKMDLLPLLFLVLQPGRREKFT